MGEDFLGQLGGGGHHLPALGPCRPGSPPPPPSDHLLLLPLESPIWTLRFVMHRAHHKILGRGRWVWVDERGVHKVKPLRVGGAPREWRWQPEMPGGKKGQVAPPSDKGVKMFEMAQYNIFTPCVKTGGGGRAFPIPLQLSAGHGARGYGVRWEEVGVVPDVVGDHGAWGLQPVGGQPGGVWRIGAQHRLPPQAQDPQQARSRSPPAAAPHQPPGRLLQGRGGNPPHPPHARHGMLCAF